MRNADPANVAARDLSIAVHETLLESAKTEHVTGNFWLTGWLQNQIKKLKAEAA